MKRRKKPLLKKLNTNYKLLKTLATELEKVSVTIPVQVGEEDKIFGTVTSQMIADNLKEKGYEIDKRKIEIDEAIKTLGIYSVNIKVHPNVGAKVKVWVVRE